MKAYPVPSYVNANGETHDVQHQGMDLRDYFAAKAMQSIITDGKLGLHLTHGDYMKFVSETSYEYADAMIKARK